LRSISDLILVKWHVTCIMMVDDTIRGPADFLRQTSLYVSMSHFILEGGCEWYSNPIVNPSFFISDPCLFLVDDVYIPIP